MFVILRYIEVCQQAGPYTKEQSISMESNYVFKDLQMQDLDFIPVYSPLPQIQRMDPPVNLQSYWKSVSLHWTSFCYWVILLRREIWQRVKVNLWIYMTSCRLIDVSTSLHQVATYMTPLNGVRSWKTVAFTVCVLQFNTLRNR